MQKKGSSPVSSSSAPVSALAEGPGPINSSARSVNSTVRCRSHSTSSPFAYRGLTPCTPAASP